MEPLTPRERNLVALGAALGSNCVPCVERHVPEARKAGLDEAQIEEALQVADQVRRAPAQAVLSAAKGALARSAAEPAGCATPASPAPARTCCG